MLSLAVFRSRAAQIGLSEAIIDLMVAQDIKSMGSLSFACAFQPGSADETPFTDMVKAILTRNPTIGEAASFRRLYYESHTVTLSDMRNRIDRTDDSPAVKVQAPERAARHSVQQLKLAGIKLSGPYECSHALIDKVFQQFDDNQLRYIGWDELTCREQEILGEKKDVAITDIIKASKMDGSLRVERGSSSLRADLSDNLKIKNALTRRSLAYDQANLVTFATMEAWNAKMFSRMAEPQPVEYCMITLDQCMQSDKRLFVRMAEETRASIVAMPGQPKPLDLALAKWEDHCDVLYLMTPLPRPAGKHEKPWVERPNPYSRPTPDKGKGKGHGKGKGKGTDKGKGKGGSKGGKKGKGPPSGCVAQLSDGKYVCYSYNRPGGCSSTVEAGGSCYRGVHKCGYAGCHQNHPMFDCPNH